MPCHRIFFSLMYLSMCIAKHHQTRRFLFSELRRQRLRKFFLSSTDSIVRICTALSLSLTRSFALFFSYSCFIKTFRLYNYYGYCIGVDGQEMRFIMYSIYTTECRYFIYFIFNEKANVCINSVLYTTVCCIQINIRIHTVIHMNKIICMYFTSIYISISRLQFASNFFLLFVIFFFFSSFISVISASDELTKYVLKNTTVE